MRRVPLIVLIALCALFAFVPGALAQPTTVTTSGSVSSGELVEHPKKWDGREISFTGEAITEAQERGANAWIHINDDAYELQNVEEGAPLKGYNSGMAVWIPTELTQQVAHYGDYRNEGDVVTVTGVFHAACAEHGGDMDIHATSLVVETPGHPVTDPISSWKPIAAAVLLVLAAALWLAHRRLEHREAFGG